MSNTIPLIDVIIVGENAHAKAMELNKKYVPNKLFVGCFEKSELELLEGKYIEGATMIYVCENKVCQLPTANILKAKELMK